MVWFGRFIFLQELQLYKSEDKVYHPAFLFDGKETRIIPGYDENIDAICIARCYVRSINEKRMFFYHKKTKVLNTPVYSDLPILITRALFLFSKENYKDPDFDYNKLMISSICEFDLNGKFIREIPINEIMRIFGKNTVEVIDD